MGFNSGFKGLNIWHLAPFDGDAYNEN